MKDRQERLELRHVVRDDAELLFHWANEPTVRQRSISIEPIVWEDHLSWLEDVISDDDRRLYILELDGTPVGQIRFDRVGEYATVNVSLDVEQRGHGLGKAIIELGIIHATEELHVDRFVALVRPDNERSRNAFEAVGFEHERREERSGVSLLRLERASDDGLPRFSRR